MEACEKCDAIIPAKAIREGKARKTETGYLCEECTGAAAPAPPASTPAPPPPEEEVEGVVIEEETPAPPAPTRSTPRSTPQPVPRRQARRAPAPPRARPARAAVPRGPASPARGAGPGARKSHPKPHRHRPIPKQEGLDLITKVGLVVAAVLVIGAGSFYTVVQIKQANKERARQEAEAKSAAAAAWIEDLLEQAKKADTEDWWVGAEAKIAEKREELLSGSQDESRYGTSEGRFRTMRDRFDYEQQSRADLTTAKGKIQDCATIVDGVTLLEKLDSTGALMGDSFREEVGGLLQESREKAVACKMEEAEEYQRLNQGDYKGILQRFLEARDVLIELHQNLPDTPEGKEKKAKISEQIKETIAIEDEVAGLWYSSGYEDEVEWRNLLVPSEFPKDAEDKTANWGGSPGVAFHLEDGKLIIEGTPGGRAASLGVVGVGVRERWIDYDLDLEVKVIAAGFDLLARLHPTLPYVQFGLRVMPGESLIEEGKTYQIVQKVHSGTQWLSVNGEELEQSKLGNDVRHPGGIGFAVEHDARLEITRMRVKVLR